MPARDVSTVLADLDGVIDDAVSTGTALAYFPAMYRSVTATVGDALGSGGFFEDDTLCERFTVTFADLYLEAYRRHRRGETVARCWQLAFAVAEDPRRRMILQHLLLGMNAHINYDLGLAVSRVVGRKLPILYGDFIRVNEILFRMLDSLQDSLGSVSSRLRWLDRAGVAADEWLMRFSIRTARDLAWRFADNLAGIDDPVGAIEERDADTAAVGRLVARRWSPVHLVGRFVAAREPRTPQPVVDALVGVEIDLGHVAGALPVRLIPPATTGGSPADAARLARRRRPRAR